MTNNLFLSFFNSTQEQTESKRLTSATSLFSQAKLAESFDKCHDSFKSFFAGRIVPKHFICDFHVGQFVTGHGSFRRYLHKRNLHSSDLCPCGSGSVHDSYHILVECIASRSFIVDLFSFRPNQLCTFTETNENFVLFKKLCSTMRQTLLSQCLST